MYNTINNKTLWIWRCWMWQVVLGIYLIISGISCFIFWTSLVLAKKSDGYIRSSFLLYENNNLD